MTTSTRRFFLATAAATMALACGATAAQDAYPSRMIRIVVPFPAGGGTDNLARPLAEGLAKRLGQTVIIENKAGAGGNLGTDFVAKSPPDGYTLLLTPPAPIMQAIALYKKLPYNPQTDFRLVSDIAQSRAVCAVGASLPVKSFKELIDYAKANPGKLTMGSWGAGTQPHQVQVYMDKTYGTQTLHVPYKGEAQMLNDLIGGQIAMTCGSVTAIKQHVATGKLRVIGAIGPNRAAGMPDVPTLGEQGYRDEIYTLTGPFSLLAPAKTPQAIVDRLGKEVSAIVKSPEMTKAILDMGMEVIGNLPAEADAGYKARLPATLKSIRDTGVTLD